MPIQRDEGPVVAYVGCSKRFQVVEAESLLHVCEEYVRCHETRAGKEILYLSRGKDGYEPTGRHDGEHARTVVANGCNRYPHTPDCYRNGSGGRSQTRSPGWKMLFPRLGEARAINWL